MNKATIRRWALKSWWLGVLAIGVGQLRCGTADKDTGTGTGSGSGSNVDTNGLTAEANFTIGSAVFSADNGSYSSKTFGSCIKDLSSGLLTVLIGDGATSLEVRIKDFRSAAATYTCVQAANNVSDPTALGDKFTSCMVDAKATPAGATSTNGYSMHRESLTMPAFTYAGACSVVISGVDTRVTGSVACNGMVQTMLEGAYRNPINPASTGNVNGDFYCDLMKQ